MGREGEGKDRGKEVQSEDNQTPNPREKRALLSTKTRSLSKAGEKAQTTAPRDSGGDRV